MKRIIQSILAVFFAVIFSFMYTGCGEVTALKEKYCAELDAYYQEVLEMDLEYSTALIKEELTKGKEKIQQLKWSSKIVKEAEASKLRAQEYLLSQEELSELKEEIGQQYSTILAYMGKTSKDGYHIIVFDHPDPWERYFSYDVGGYSFQHNASRFIYLVKNKDEVHDLRYAFYTDKIVDEEDVAEIHARYTIVYNDNPNIFESKYPFSK